MTLEGEKEGEEEKKSRSIDYNISTTHNSRTIAGMNWGGGSFFIFFFQRNSSEINCYSIKQILSTFTFGKPK